MYSEKIVKCMSCDKSLFQALLNFSSIVDIKYCSNCPYCNFVSFYLNEKTTYITPCDGLVISEVEDISDTEKRLKIEKKK